MEARAERDGLTAVAWTVTGVVGAALASMLVRQRPVEEYYQLFMFHNAPSALVLAWMSRLVLRRQPGNGAGRVLLAIAIVNATHVAVAAFTHARSVSAGLGGRLLDAAPDLRMSELPLDVAIGLCATNSLWVPAPVLMITALPLVFPDGRLPSRRWRPAVVAAATGGTMLTVAFVVDAWPTSSWTASESPAIVAVLTATGGLAVLASAVAAFASFALRWRRADARQRRQFHTVGAPAGILALAVIALYPWPAVWIPVSLAAVTAVLAAYAVAVARLRLHDVEPVLGRAAVGAILSTVVAATYAMVVVGIGSLAGHPFDNALLPVVAMAIVVLLTEPTRRRAKRLVDRLLYRADTDRTQVMSRLAARASTSSAAEDVLAEVAELLVRSTGAARAEVWLDTDLGRPATAAGSSDEVEPAQRAAIGHQDVRFGELRLYARAVKDLVPDTTELIADVAHALGVVLRNDQLATQMRGQLDELRASRQRLVEAHDVGRRSLERDIHDGAQSRLIALRFRLAVARSLAEDPDDRRLADELDDIGREVEAAVRSLRDLARGLHPPILEQSGPAAALRAHSRDLPIPVTVTATGPDRYPQVVEGAVYFCCLEAIQNAVRHSRATTIAVDLDGDDTASRFQVCDDGDGFDPRAAGRGAGLTNIDDRVGALGGHVRIVSEPGVGTRISGEIPARRVRR